MRILYFCDLISIPGGLPRVIIEKANYLSKDNDVFILTTKQSDKVNFYTLSSNVIHLCYQEYSGTNNILFSKKKFNYIISIVKPDVIIAATGKESMLLPFFDRKKPKIKEMHFSHNYRSIHNVNAHILKRMAIKIINVIEPWVYSKYDAVVPLTYEDEKRWKLGNTTVIYNPSTMEVNKTASLGCRTVIAVGRLSHEKGFDLLLNAWEKVCNNNNDWMLNIFGDGPLKNKLIQLSNKLKISHRVSFEGNVKDIREKYLKSSIFVMSSRHEGLPLTLIEAMECGLPVVSFNCQSGPAEIIKNEVNGFLVPNEDVKELANKLLDLIKDKEKRVLFGNNSKKDTNKFNKQLIMKQWDELFKEVIKNRLAKGDKK